MSGDDTAIGRGTRRKKFAGYLRAANEMRQSYTQAYLGSGTRSEFEEDDGDIPGAFPNLKVSRSGNEELVLFPSYARQHTKRATLDYAASSNIQNTQGGGDADYWRKEWEFHEDANAVVDVDVRGWIYNPHQGPMNRKNRILLGIARHLSGIPAPPSGTPDTNRYEDKIAEKQAQNITKRGEDEADIADRGGYSEGFGYTSTSSSRSVSPKPGHILHPVTNTSLYSDQNDASGFGSVKKSSSWGTTASDMSPEDLATANTQLLRRLRPFFTTPAVGMSVTMFFYNDKTSQSRSTHTNDSGHFNFRAALDFIPTHVRVLASEDLSASSEVIITEPKGISLISDIDDTIKHSAIVMGAREIFRNAFVRELGDLVVNGVESWYRQMAEMGVKIHYVSNSPWQMYPLLVTYFATAKLPPGSFHLKQYTGMLQGIFEPVAERKKATLDRIMSDFPDRRFILVGDSGEADLELYTETVLRDPKRILAIFIRDVSTTQSQGFFNGSLSSKASGDRSDKVFRTRPSNQSSSKSALAVPRPDTLGRSKTDFPSAPEVEDLMTFSDGETSPSTTLSKTNSSQSNRQKPLPPSKPLALRSKSTASSLSASTNNGQSKPVQLSPPRQTVPHQSDQTESGIAGMVKTAYSALPSTQDVWGDGTSPQHDVKELQAETSNSDTPPALPPRRGLTTYPAAAASYASNRIAGYWNGTDQPTNQPSQPPINKREELWNRRLARARQSLQGTGVIFKTWRVGADVEKEAVDLVAKYMGK